VAVLWLAKHGAVFMARLLHWMFLLGVPVIFGGQLLGWKTIPDGFYIAYGANNLELRDDAPAECGKVKTQTARSASSAE
jgi:hypothetical protein